MWLAGLMGQGWIVASVVRRQASVVGRQDCAGFSDLGFSDLGFSDLGPFRIPHSGFRR